LQEEQRITIEEALWPIVESISTVRTKNGIKESREVHNEMALLRIEKGLPPLLQLAQTDEEKGIQFLRERGLDEFEWFAVLHVRDTGDLTYGRNAKIKDYLPAISLIKSQGGIVIRIGDSNMADVGEVEGLVDLTRGPKPFEAVDLFLIAKARFMIATTSGPQNVAYCFDTPMIWTNAPDIGNAVFYPNAIMIPKLVTDENDNVLSLTQMLNSDAGWSDSSAGYIVDPHGHSIKLKWLDNSPTDILNAVESFIESGFPRELTESQTVWNLTLSSYRKHVNTNVCERFMDNWEKNLLTN
jgi:putative glycosyltransferase (TIGR04372 family)